ncbi:MAG TPA: hypothetical protein VGQ90_01990 [Stellaceae bacterium]|nr:hypothetical protein [Stellaceae bacterium]
MADDEYSWHDDLIYGLHLRSPDPDRNIWRSELVLDIDHIVEWVPKPEGCVAFLMAPAILVFHDVGDLKIAIDFTADDGYQRNLNELAIDRIEREPMPTARTESYRWRIKLNLPARGEISFIASRFTLTLAAPPQLTDEQRFPAGHRPPFSLGTLG